MPNTNSNMPAQERPFIVVSLSTLKLEVLRGIMDIAEDAGWDVLNLRWTDDMIPKGRIPLGAVVSYGPGDPLVKKLNRMHCKTVRICGHPLPAPDAIPDIICDMHTAGKIAADHFAERNFKHVAYIGHRPWSGSRNVYEGFTARSLELGIECHLLQLSSTSGEDSRAKREKKRVAIVGDWLSTLPNPVGLLTYSDERAARCCLAAAQAGLAIPDDVAILGCGNTPLLCETSPVKLSSIDYNLEVTGRRAALLLKSMVEGKQAPQKPIYIQPSGVIQRQSTNVFATNDRDITRALRFLWGNCHRSIGIDDIARASGLPRRTFTRRFKKSIGRTVSQELHRKRIENVCQLLIETDYSATDIAAMSGFRTESLLYRSFKSQFGLTPCQYRTSRQNE